MANAGEADRLRKEGLEASDASLANASGDRWVLHTVIVTLSLFFLGIATQARLRVVRRATLGIGALVLAAMFVSVARPPRAPDDSGGQGGQPAGPPARTRPTA